jgi:hypothetical protein
MLYPGKLTGQARQHRLESGWNFNEFGDQNLNFPLNTDDHLPN